MAEARLSRAIPLNLVRIWKEDDLVLLELQFLPIQLPIHIATNAL